VAGCGSPAQFVPNREGAGGIRFFGNRGRTVIMSRRTIFSLAASVIIGIGCIATISTDAFAYRGGRAGVGRAGVYHGGAYRGAAYRGGVYRGAAVRRGVAVGVGAAAVGAAAYGAYGSYGAPGCGYPPNPPCY
jgi:hypothetical protein